MLIFSGTNYLNVSNSQSFRQFVEQGFDRYGLHYGGSRFSDLCPGVFEKAEQLLASVSGAEAALIVSSGSKAGILATRLIRENAKVIADRDVHPALLNIQTKVHLYDSPSSAVLDRTEPDGSFAILSNAIDPLRCRPINFSFVEKLQAGDILIVDDSHGLGVRGTHGGGIYQELRTRTRARLIVSGSLGKGFGIPGGVLLSDAETINAIKSLPSFGGGAPPPAAYVHAFLKGQSYYEQAREKLQQNIHYFKTSLIEPVLFRYLDNYPVFYTQENSLAPYLREKGMLISSFRYPTPSSDLISRIVLSSAHSSIEIDQLVKAIDAFTKL